MNDNHKIIDNFLDLEDFKRISNFMLGENFPWFYHSEVTNENEYSENYYFTHQFYWKYNITSSFFEHLTPLIEKINPLSLIRIKGNLYPNINKFVVHDPHTDFPDHHLGAIFYINTNNGKTIIDKKYEISSISNRLLLFNPSIEHQSTNCTDEKCRININFNYF
jgi:hypothetical protein